MFSNFSCVCYFFNDLGSHSLVPVVLIVPDFDSVDYLICVCAANVLVLESFSVQLFFRKIHILS